MTSFFISIFVGAFGWCLVWALIKLIFYPIHPIEIGPFKWESLASKWIGKLDLTEIVPQLTQNDSFETLKPVINEKLDHFFRNKLSSKLPMIAMFIGDKTIEELKTVFMEELALLFPSLIHEFSANLNKDLTHQWQQTFSKIALQKINNASKPFRWIAFGLGAIWGYLISVLLPLI